MSTLIPPPPLSIQPLEGFVKLSKNGGGALCVSHTYQDYSFCQIFYPSVQYTHCEKYFSDHTGI